MSLVIDRAIVALTTYCEASGSSPFERRAVVHSIFNRVKDGRFGKTAAEVCLELKQYSEFNDDKGDNNNLRRGARAGDDDPIMKDCLAAFDEVDDGAADTTNGATHYHDKSIAAPYWAANATVALETDQFIFYSHVP